VACFSVVFTRIDWNKYYYSISHCVIHFNKNGDYFRNQKCAKEDLLLPRYCWAQGL
jgi:hypothetical protein